MAKSNFSEKSRRSSTVATKVPIANDEPAPSTTTGQVPTGKVELLSFKEALDISKGAGDRHLMLGNGFSIALRPDIFTYNTLLERAKESKKLSKAMVNVFAKLGTTDFEMVMEALENAAVLVSLYEESNPKLATLLQQEASRLRDVLAETVADNHPARRAKSIARSRICGRVPAAGLR